MSFEGSRRLMFSIFEKQLLLKLIDKYKDVIEVKEFNKQAWLKKNEAFMKIQKEFNKTPGVVRRTAQQLRQCYFNLKKRSSKKNSKSNSNDTMLNDQVNFELISSVLETPSESNSSFVELVVPKEGVEGKEQGVPQKVLLLSFDRASKIREPIDDDEMSAPASTVANIPSVVYISSAEQSNSQPPRPPSALAILTRTPTAPAAPLRAPTPRTPTAPAAPPRTPTPVPPTTPSCPTPEPPEQSPPPRVQPPAHAPPPPQASQRREAVRAAKAILEQNMKIQYEKLKHEREEKEHMLRVKLYESQIKGKTAKRSFCKREKLKKMSKMKLRQLKRRRLPSNSSDEGKRVSNSKVRSELSPGESSDGDELILKSELKRIKGEHDRVARKLKLKIEEICQLKKKNEELQELNIGLQKQLLSMLNANDSLLVSASKSKEAKKLADKKRDEALECVQRVLVPFLEGERTPPPPQTLTVPDTLPISDSIVVSTSQDKTRDEDIECDKRVEEPSLEESNSSLLTDSSSIFLDDNGNSMKWKDDQIELAPGIILRKEQWLKVISNNNLNESKVIRNLAAALWDPDTLRMRSVTGAACRRFIKDGVDAKKALTPIKVDAVRNGLRYWLKEHKHKGEQEVQKLSSMKAVRKKLAEKIMDLSKQHKKRSKN